MQTTLHYVVGSVSNHSALVVEQMQQLFTVARAGDLKDTVDGLILFGLLIQINGSKKHSVCHVQPSTLLSKELDISLNEIA